MTLPLQDIQRSAGFRDISWIARYQPLWGEYQDIGPAHQGLAQAKGRILASIDPAPLVWVYEPHQYMNIKRNNQTTSTKCQYHAAASKPK